ncbi:hypothetical protein P152DRAFT_475128 [Eremomyces bilateralis CBS 781.70]|uniref:Uncharacterized protein n=1 Tax=Eremomyces bilateralis CBS 781.70 TaxID=1392243 RepID=A0A6G1FZI6_9PEZI|nr:uncharacterized protein P152DRAFT_475128 [Eremomyces bilateralis CBS 781.70]KAF1811080.1 hypothetical protein P152DRAFT_475128 [Eremomyces bilateralis CBS 781.70]
MDYDMVEGVDFEGGDFWGLAPNLIAFDMVGLNIFNFDLFDFSLISSPVFTPSKYLLRYILIQTGLLFVRAVLGLPNMQSEANAAGRRILETTYT